MTTATVHRLPPPLRLAAAFRWIVRGRTDTARWERPALLGLLAATSVLYLWNLGANGWANSFYSAGGHRRLGGLLLRKL